ncbi:MAG: hypothetical protein JSS57_00710 [Proteobacteria bacterium]|nr:hypothetical protein [Pseudomonadota bacterium]
MNSCKVRRWTLTALYKATLSATIGMVGISAVHAQQQTPPRATELRIYKPIDASKLTVEKHEAFKADVFKGVALSPEQQMTVLGNLGTLGCTPTKVMQQTLPTPPGLASGEACRNNYAGTPQELRALRKVLTELIRRNNAADIAPFEAGIPKDCPYKELYYYLDLLAQVTGGA